MSGIDFKAIDVRTFLTELGIGDLSEHRNSKTGLEIRFSCPYPAHAAGDRHPSAQMNAETTAFRCFSCGAKGNAVTFLAELENVSPLVAARWIRERFGGGFRDVAEGSLWQDLRSIMEGSKPVVLPTVEPIDEAELARRAVDWTLVWKSYAGGEEIPPQFTYMLDRGLSWDTCEQWEIGYDAASDRVTIPVRGHDGRLVGFKARAWDDRQPKYLVLGGIGYGFEPYETSRVVFGLHRAVTRADGVLVLREGELNVVAMHQKGFPWTAGISGHFLSDDQVRLLISRAGVDEVLVWWDDVVHALEAVEKLLPYVRTKIVPPSTEADPMDMDAATIQEYLDAAESAIELEIPLA